LLGLADADTAFGQDDRHILLVKPTEYTDVLDAFEGGQRPDFNVGLSYHRTHGRSTVVREHAALGDRIAGRTSPVAVSEQTTNALALELAVGLWRDLMVYGRLPLVLSDTRSLRLPRGHSSAEVAALLGTAGNDPPLIDLSTPYHSATRSGVPGIDIGVAWGIVNQFRTRYLPTWVVAAESRIGLGRVMEPCADAAQCETGINRGTFSLALSTRFSYRVRFAEPYLGLRYVHEWATTASERFRPESVPGYVDTALPSQRELTLGVALVTWEDRSRFQRLALDVRGAVAYVSAGRDYSVLFDALGASKNPQLSQPYLNKSVYFNGLTDVAAYARMSAELSLAMQAARYIRFRLGVQLAHATTHISTDAAACGMQPPAACPNERINPLYRPVIDLPGQRFLQTKDLGYDLFANAVGEF
jgi:hypothetical protein